MPWPPVTPVFAAGQEPLPPGMTEDDRAQIMQARKYEDYMKMGAESCVAKTVMAGVGGASFILCSFSTEKFLCNRSGDWSILLSNVVVICV